MFLFLLLHLVSLVVMSLWLGAHGEEIARALVTALLSVLLIAVVTLCFFAYAVAAVCRRRKRT